MSDREPRALGLSVPAKVAIPRAGLATAQAECLDDSFRQRLGATSEAVWSCSAIIVSFGWGALGPAEVAAPARCPAQ